MTAFSRQHAYAASMAPEHMRERYVGFLRFACLGIVAALLIVSRTEQNTP